jgi:hypothetical protein
MIIYTQQFKFRRNIRVLFFSPAENPEESDFTVDADPTTSIPWVLQRELKILDNRFHV